MSDAKPKHPPHGLDVPAGVLAAVFPGLGHLARGEARRGVLAGVSVLAMFFGGMLIGGIDVVDSREDKWWFYGQAFVGPIAFGVDWAHQNMFKAYGVPPTIDEDQGRTVYRTTLRQLEIEHARRSLFPGETRREVDVEIFPPSGGGPPEVRRLPVASPAPDGSPPNRKSLAKVNEIGTLYALCAGMLNLIVILDALFPSLARKGARGG